jgi:hypothetical protein
VTDTPYFAAPELFFRYPSAGDPSPPGGAKVLLLTKHGICITGTWGTGQNLLGWAPLPKRDKDKEALISNKTAAAKCCEHCDDGDGNCAYPYYGVAPHTHAPGPMLGSTRMLGPESWPANFTPDAGEDNTCGTYTHCLSCGRPKPRS